jgi:hypothetical protein
MWRCCWMRPGRHAAPKPLARIDAAHHFGAVHPDPRRRAKGARKTPFRIKTGPILWRFMFNPSMANKSTEKMTVQ